MRYRCKLCGRDKFTSKQPHKCVGGFRKRKIIWEEIKMERKYTAIEWFIKEMSKKNTEFAVYVNANTDILDKAIDLEKQQIISAASTMYLNGISKYPITANEYYTETFGDESPK